VSTTWSAALERKDVTTAVSVPHAARSVGEVRRRVRDSLQQQGLGNAMIESAEMVVAELLGNAVRHARPLPDGTVAVEWVMREGIVDVTVTDGGSPMLVTLRTAPPMATGGRGLQIVSVLARSWGVVELTRGRRVWAAVVPADGCVSNAS